MTTTRTIETEFSNKLSQFHKDNQSFDFLITPRFDGKLSHDKTATETVYAKSLEEAKIEILNLFETNDDLIMYKGKIVSKATAALRVVVQNVENGDVTLTFPTLLNAQVTLHRGTHINSVNNWQRVVPHGNCKKKVENTVEKYASSPVRISITEMINVDESKYPNQIKYRLVVDGNFGKKGYCSTGDMRLTKEQFNSLTKGLEARVGKNYRQYVIK